MSMWFAGADGCRAGWVSVPLRGDGLFGPAEVHSSFAGLVAASDGADLLLVDIPIGLLSAGAGERACDSVARHLVGERRSSVFRVPVREAVHAHTYDEARRANQQRTGRMISVQAWGICRKIAEADRAMSGDPGLQARVRETHPEVCFAALQGWRPLTTSKRSREGGLMRLEILTGYVPNAAAALADARRRYPRTQLAADDVLDAMVAAVAARAAAVLGMPTLPAEPPVDARGLRMEIVCPAALPG